MIERFQYFVRMVLLSEDPRAAQTGLSVFRHLTLELLNELL